MTLQFSINAVKVSGARAGFSCPVCKRPTTDALIANLDGAGWWWMGCSDHVRLLTHSMARASTPLAEIG